MRCSQIAVALLAFATGTLARPVADGTIENIERDLVGTLLGTVTAIGVKADALVPTINNVTPLGVNGEIAQLNTGATGNGVHLQIKCAAGSPSCVAVNEHIDTDNHAGINNGLGVYVPTTGSSVATNVHVSNSGVAVVGVTP